MQLTTIILGSRKSDLAKIQAYSVGNKIIQQNPSLKVKYKFSSSFGDKNQDLDLDQAIDKGLFTADLKTSLEKREVDVVVHSWKDLPIENSSITEIVSTFPRKDMRDLFLIKKDKITASKKSQFFRLLTSSPRREYHFKKNAHKILPWKLKKIEAISIRGNILTRMKIFFEDPLADGFILAKAAVDRILESKDFPATTSLLKDYLDLCEFIVLPLTWFPSAAAQGALAIEVRRGDEALKKILKAICCDKTFLSVQKEREVLNSFGGGCHQKIGVSFLSRSYGDIKIIKGQLDSGEILDKVEFVPARKMPLPKKKQDCWPLNKEVLFHRKLIDLDLNEKKKVADSYIFLARAFAWPSEAKPPRFLWTSGVNSWEKLSQRGVFVNGSSESLGEVEDRKLGSILSNSKNWLKLTHSDSLQGENSLATYQLTPLPKISYDLSSKTHFYWMSASQFYQAKKDYPQIISGIHSCGPGNTARSLQKIIESERLFIWNSYESWLRSFQEIASC